MEGVAFRRILDRRWNCEDNVGEFLIPPGHSVLHSIGTMSSKSPSRIPIGISSCLLGESVRYDGGHKRNAYLVDVLGKYFEFIPFCPEVAIGLGTPRPPIRLTGNASSPRAVGVKNPQLDVSDALMDYARSVVADAPRLCGYVLKRGSPSCGMERVKVYDSNGMPSGFSSGLYAGVIMRAFPTLPVEEEGRLSDPILRESFVTRVFVLVRWQHATCDGMTPGKLVDFHTRHKYLLLSHSEVHYRQLGRLVADAGNREIDSLSNEYLAVLMDGLKRRATRRRHSNVLQHIMGYLKRSIDAGDKAELACAIDEYRNGTVPLVVPMKLVEHHFRRHPNDYIALQAYMNPYPAELGLRNHL